MIEFVSANPTGPADRRERPPRRVRRRARADPRARRPRRSTREYYFNDAGAQIDRLGASIRARARGEAPPEDGYQGDYVAELAAADPRRGRADADDARRASGVELDRSRGIRATLERLPRRTSTAGSSSARSTTATPSAVDRALARLEEQGHSYRVRGRAVAAHDDVRRRQGPRAVRSTGEPTYFAADVAYHEDKLERGYDRLINVLGADHHGYVARHEGGRWPRSAPTRTGSRSRCCSSSTSSRAASARRCPSAAATSSRSTS